MHPVDYPPPRPDSEASAILDSFVHRSASEIAHDMDLDPEANNGINALHREYGTSNEPGPRTIDQWRLRRISNLQRRELIARWKERKRYLRGQFSRKITVAQDQGRRKRARYAGKISAAEQEGQAMGRMLRVALRILNMYQDYSTRHL